MMSLRSHQANREEEGMVEIRAIVRIEMLDRVVHRLKRAGVPRLTVTRAHPIGTGVDPASRQISFQEVRNTSTRLSSSSSATESGARCTRS